MVGPPKSGKTSLIQEVVKCLPASETKYAQVSCLSATIRTADIFENVLKQMEGEEAVENSCTSFADFVNRMIKISSKRMVVVLKNADRLRSLDANLLPGLMKLNELIPSSDISVVLISKFPWCRWRLSNYLAATPPIHVFLRPYSRSQLGSILQESLKQNDEPQVLKDNFVELILGVFQPVCKSLPQFRRAADLCWPEYILPTKDKNVEPDNSKRLYRFVEPHLRKVLANIHYQEASSMMGEESKSKRLNVELPFFSKYLLLAAYLSSYNPQSTDKRFFMQRKSGRVVKKSKSTKQQSHLRSSQLLGPKMFDLNRMLAIFHVIVGDQKVNSTAEIQSQVASLVKLQMLTQSGEDLDLPKYKCNVTLDFIRQVAKNVRFELHKYMYDCNF